MNRKLIEKVKTEKILKKGNVISACVVENTLVIDCFAEKEFQGRYCLEQSGRHVAYIDGNWCIRSLAAMFGWSSYWWSVPNARFNNEQTENAIYEYISAMQRKGYTSSNLLSAIASIEYDYNYDQRIKAADRKAERINQLMENVQTLPTDFEEWCRRVVFENKNYMFFDKEKNVYHCTACGKTHTFKKAKHNEQRLCCRSELVAIVKRRQSCIEEKERVMIIQQMDEETSVARHFKVCAKYEKDNVDIQPYEEIRITLPKAKKDIVQQITGKKSKPRYAKVYYGQRHEADEYGQIWNDRNPYNKHTFSCYCYPNGVKEALDGTVYEHIRLDKMAVAGWKLQYNKLMRYERLTGCYEYFFQGRFKRLACELSEEFSDWYMRSAVNVIGKDAQTVLKLDKQRINRLRQADGGLLYLKWLQEEQWQGCKLTEAAISWFEKNNLSPSVVSFIVPKMSPVQVSNYLQRQHEESRKSIKSIINTWKDYLSMAQRQGLDVNDEIVYRPKELIRRHDELVERIAAQNAAQRVKELRKQFTKVGQICKSLTLYEMDIGEYKIIKPKGIADIVFEGNMQHHCVGSSGHYFSKIEKGESYILFLRKKDEPAKPYYTLEVKPDGTILQRQSKFNRQPDIKTVDAILSEWKKAVKKRLNAKKNIEQKEKIKHSAISMPA